MTIEQMMKIIADSEARQIAAINEMKAMMAAQNERLAALSAKVDEMVANRQTVQDRYAAEDMTNAGK